MLIKLPVENIWVKAQDVDEIKIYYRSAYGTWIINILTKNEKIYEITGISSLESAQSLAKDFAERVNKALGN